MIDVLKKNKDKILTINFCFFVSLVILLITSKCSPFYPLNDWVDANAFFTTGKAMFNGVIPYRDLFEQKGLLLYFIYGIGYLISNTSFLGVFILEVIFWTISLYYVYKTILLFLSKKSAFIIIPIYTACICISRAFVHGGGAEEFCLPFFSITLYYFLNHFKTKEISYKNLFICGFCAGSILLIKYTLLGFWFAFMATIFFNFIINKKYKKAFISCIIFLLGMFTPILISLIYLGINHAIKDFFEVYFVINMSAYGEDATGLLNRITTLFGGFVGTCRNSGLMELILIVFMPLFMLKLDLKKSGKISLFIVYLFSILGIFWGLKFYRYYMFPMLVFIIISLIVITSIITKYIKLDKWKWPIVISVILSIFIAYQGANYKEMLFMAKDDMFQFEFADIINEEENPTLVNLGYLDCGLYTTSGVVPTTYFFERQNLSYDKFPDNIDSFRKYVEEKETMFIIYFTKIELDRLYEVEEKLFENYDLIKFRQQDFERENYIAYLFRRKV